MTRKSGHHTLAIIFVFMQAVLTCGASGPSLSGDWATFGNGPGHTSYFPGLVAEAKPVLAWSATLDPGLNQVATGQGRVYVTSWKRLQQVDKIWALDEQTGQEVWKLTVNPAWSINPPTYQNGYIYIQRANHDDSQLLCLNAASGQVHWSTPFTCQSDKYYAPTVVDGRVWVNAGTYGGVQGFRQSDGKALFFSQLEQYDEWTPTAYSNRIYTFTDGKVRQFSRGHASHPQDNPEGWGEDWRVDLDWEGSRYEMNSVLAAADGRLYAVGTTFLLDDGCLAAVDIAAKKAAWQINGGFAWSPAVANGVVYAIHGGKNVRAYRASDGELLGTFAAATELRWNLIVTDDVLICSSEEGAYVFDLKTYQALYTLPHGGRPTLANGSLLLAGTDGVLRSYRFEVVESPPTLVFAQYVNGMIGDAPNRTRVVLRNNYGAADSGRIQFRDAGGFPVTIPVGGAYLNGLNFSVPAWGSVDVETDGTGVLKSGSIAVFSNQGAASKLEGTEIFEVFGHFVCVDAIPPRSTHQVYVSHNSEESTGVALLNPNKEAVTLDIELVDAQGIQAALTVMTLNSGQRSSSFVTEQALFQSYFDIHPGGFEGTLNIRARDHQLISAVGLIQKSGTGALISVPSSPNAHTP